MPTRNTWGVLIVLIGIAVLLAGLSTGYQAAGYEHTIENETHDVDYNAESSLDAPEYTFSYSTTVTVTANNTTLDAGSDYEYNSSVGNITWLNSSATSDGDDAFVTYTYEAPTEGAHERNQLLGSVVQIVAYAALAVGVFATVQLMSSGW